METEGSLPHSQQPATCPYPEPEQTSPCPYSISWRLILISFSHRSLGLPSCLFLTGFPTKTLFAPLIFPLRATCPANFTLFHLITRNVTCGEQYRSISFSLCNFLHSPVTASLLGPTISLNTLFSNVLSLRSSLSFTPIQNNRQHL